MADSAPKPSGMTLEEEKLHFFADLGRALDEWSRIEVHVFCIFMVCLRAPHQRAAAAFYAVENFRSKLKMVDAVFQLAISEAETTEETRTAARGRWTDLHDEIVEKSKSRNALAHHEVLENAKLKPGKRMALRPAILNPRSPSTFKDVGLHIQELRDRQTAFRKLGDAARQFFRDLPEIVGRLPESF